jgi:Icc-related predicted phosphoesterase
MQVVPAMKILLLSDIHGRSDMAAATVARHPEVDFIFISGDITNFGDADSARSVIDALSYDGKRRTIFAVAGNCDSTSVRNYMQDTGLEVEGTVNGLPFATLIGAGGGLKRAGLTTFERTENQLKEALAPQLIAASGNGCKRPYIVLTHTPPYGTNADCHGENHVGSREFARLMIKYSADVWICGHIHESRCVSREDGVLVVNPGPCNCGCHAILEIDEGLDGKYRVKAQLFK